jgi:phosphoglycerate dehydrogenase-like enzyme
MDLALPFCHLRGNFMSKTVALYAPAYDFIRERLDALGLDISIITYDKDGRLYRDGTEIAPEATEIDYVWMSNFISRDKAQKPVFGLMEKIKQIGVLQTFNAGLDDPVYGRISRKGTRICNSSAQAMAISEYLVGQVLNIYQPFQQQQQIQQSKKWAITPFREIWRTNWLIVGYGPIGRETARKVKAFGASTTVIRRSPETNELVDRAGTLEQIGDLVGDADVIVLACPLNAETRGFANAEFFAKVKKGAILLNIGRGLLIDDAALMTALDEERLETAVLDVFHSEPLPTDDPLWTHPKVRMTCHTSFAGGGGALRWLELFLDNLPRYVRGEALVNEVNPNDIA